MIILVVNVGSSSHKISLFDLKDSSFTKPLWKGVLDWGREDVLPSYTLENVQGVKIQKQFDRFDVDAAIEAMLQTLWQGDSKVVEGPHSIERIGHRVVHGGRVFQQPTLITAEVKKTIKELTSLAPLHNPGNLEGIELMEKLFPNIPQIAVFDTAFHSYMPDFAKTYPVPMSWKQEGVQRYGFHGISHHYCSDRAAALLGKDLKSLKIINCHLGNGASVCAIREGRSVDTSMGMTPMEGLMMGSRCGSIDSGILLYRLREKKEPQDHLDRILNFESGLKGIAGSSDMREVMGRQDEFAQLAVEMYVYRLRGYVGAYLTHLEGVDALIFTAGIGENNAEIRRRTCEGLSFLGIELDIEKNQNCEPDQDIASRNSKTRILVIKTQEEWMIAKSSQLV